MTTQRVQQVCRGEYPTVIWASDSHFAIQVFSSSSEIAFVPFARRKNFVGRGSPMLHPKKLRRILTVAIVAYLPERLAIYWSEPKPQRSGNFFRVIWRGLQREKARE